MSLTLRAKRTLVTNGQMYRAGDILPPFVPAEEERLIALGAAEVVAEPEVVTEPESAKPGEAEPVKPAEPAHAEVLQPAPADTASKGNPGKKSGKKRSE